MDQSPAIPPSRAQIERLQAAIAKLPQAHLPTYHHFADGMYVREMHVAAGVTIIGKVHKREHVFILMQGTMLLTGDGQAAREVSAPFMVVSPPGVKRAGHAITDCICVNLHRVTAGHTEADLDAIEAELVEYDPTARLDARNEVIPVRQEALT